ncbi:MAG: dTDP-glucose 4,6-dehydratase [Chrysiogenetes bacterium]|nr:dTDP-glucose 4,6-dehydratase [Chrysiogenetes bacterium]
MSFRRILVTGAAGFIGSHFVERALEDPEVECVVGYDALTYAGRKEHLGEALEDARFTLVQGNVCDEDFLIKTLRAERIDAVVHFAAETHVDRSILGARIFMETNVTGTYTVLEACKAENIERLVHISTDEVYGPTPEGEQFKEDAGFRPSSPYAASKASADLFVQSFIKTHRLPALIVRGANNFGPRQFPEKLIPFMVHRALLGEELPLYGSGRQLRDWTYVEDFAEGVWLALQRADDGDIFNLGAGNERTNRMIVETLCDELGCDRGEIALVADRPAHDFRYAMDSSRAVQKLGWTPKAEFDEALRATIRWFAARKDWMEKVYAETADYFKDNYAGR